MSRPDESPRELLEAGPEAWNRLEPRALSDLIYRLAVEPGEEAELEKLAEEIRQALRGAAPEPLEMQLFRHFAERADDFARVKNMLSLTDLATLTGRPRAPLLRYFLLDPAFGVRATAGAALCATLQGAGRREEPGRRIMALGMAMPDPWVQASSLGAFLATLAEPQESRWSAARQALPEGPRHALDRFLADLHELRNET